MSTLPPDLTSGSGSVSPICPPITADSEQRLFPIEPGSSELNIDHAPRLTGAEQARLYFPQGMATPDIPLHLAVIWIAVRDEAEALTRWLEARLRRLPLTHGDGQGAALAELLNALRRGEITATGKGRGRRRAIAPLRWRDLKLGSHGSVAVAYQNLAYRSEYCEIELDGRALLKLWAPTPNGKTAAKHSVAEKRRAQRTLEVRIRQDTDHALTRVVLRTDPVLAGFGRNERERLITAAMLDAGVEYLIKPGRRSTRRRASSA